jgi:predicted metal-binding protein
VNLKKGVCVKKIGIIICGRYQDCGGGKCFRAMRERVGAFSQYPEDEEVELVGYSYCGGCPGGNVEYVPEEMIKNRADVIHLATGLVVGYPPCPRIRQFKQFIEGHYGIPVVIGTHPIPLKYLETHEKLPFWKKSDMDKIAGDLMKEDRKIMENYN